MDFNNKFRFLCASFVLTLVVLFMGATTSAQTVNYTVAKDVAGQATQRETARLAREVRHELLTLPWYGVFDWLEGNVGTDGRVTLRGWVVRPTTKSDAEARVKDIEGVTTLNSEIKVLPLSPNDDRLRRALYLALFSGDSPLFRYALGANPSIHIIVENGRAILKGFVSSEADKNLANVRARNVPGVFEVKNELMVETNER
jgi:hyperosmotically inducible periplasmic protein